MNADSFIVSMIAMPEIDAYYDEHSKIDTLIRRGGRYALDDLEKNVYARKVDSLLNIMYKAILREYATDTLFIRAFKNSQRAWLAFRDAQLSAIMPPRDHSFYGQIESFCRDSFFALVTQRRIEELLPWYRGIDEGDNLCGSYKVNPK